MSKNSRITNKERNLLKGAIRRVFARSELRKQVLDRTYVGTYTDPSRPRVKVWHKCELCKELTPKSYIVIDHIVPLIRVEETLEELSWDEVIEQRVWCPIDNLQGICKDKCHKEKTKAERKLRTAFKRAKRIKENK